MTKIKVGMLEGHIVHKKCGGEISTWKMKCLKCGKHFNPVLFWFNPNYFDTRRYVSFPKPTTKVLTYKGMQPMGLAKYLPNWPRWARILSFSIVMIITVGLIVWLVIL